MFKLFKIITQFTVFSRFFRSGRRSESRDIVLTSDLSIDDIHELTKTSFKALHTIKRLFFSKKVSAVSLSGVYIGYVDLEFIKENERVEFIFINAEKNFEDIKATVFTQYELNS